jgi:hypothetical protein
MQNEPTHLKGRYMLRIAKSTAEAAPPMPHAARWSQQVTQASNALDLEPGVFTLSNPQAIARSLKTAAECSTRRKSTPYRSAMSMLNFYINRAGRQLDPERRACLEAAKDELRALFGRRRILPLSNLSAPAHEATVESTPKSRDTHG